MCRVCRDVEVSLYRCLHLYTLQLHVRTSVYGWYVDSVHQHILYVCTVYAVAQPCLCMYTAMHTGPVRNKAIGSLLNLTPLHWTTKGFFEYIQVCTHPFTRFNGTVQLDSIHAVHIYHCYVDTCNYMYMFWWFDSTLNTCTGITYVYKVFHPTVISIHIQVLSYSPKLANRSNCNYKRRFNCPTKAP